MLEKKVKEYGITRLAYELGVCELSIRNKMSGKSKITPAEMIAMQKLLNLSDEEVSVIRKELSDNGTQSENAIASV